MSTYQEGDDSTFSHQGAQYRLDTLFTLTADRAPKAVPVADLKWILAYGTPDEDRVKHADLTAPLLVIREKGVYYTLDGFHRLSKAVRDKVKTLPCVLITASELASAKIKVKKKMRHQLRGLSMIMEDVAGESVGQQQEVEHVFYGKIADAHQLAELAKQPFVEKVLQEQSSGKLMGKGQEPGSTIRIRRVNGKDCVLTRKTFIPGQKGMQEETIECGEGLFEFFTKAFGECMNKMRYTVKPEGWERALELDVFLDAHGHPNGFAKYDYEVTGQDQACPPLPVTLVDMKHVNPYNATDADNALLREFMQSQAFRTS